MPIDAAEAGHSHVYLGSGHESAEKRTWAVIVLCGAMMVLEIVGGIRGELPTSDGVADLERAAESIPAQIEAGYTTICFKPSQYTDEPAEVGALCRRLVDRVTSLTGV